MTAARAAFSSSYLAGEARAAALLGPAFRDPASRILAAKRASSRRASAGLVEAIRAKDATLPPSEARARNITALVEPGTICVVTGQQVGLLLGPLYTFYKAASAIACAAALERESGLRCVPVFWLQTEDHDYAEIDHCHVPCPAGAPPFLFRIPGDDRRVSVAQRVLDEACDVQLALLGEALAALPHAGEFLALVRAHYRSGRPVADAFAGLLAALFADEGLIVFDPRDPRVAALAAPVHRRAIEGCVTIADALLERGAALRTAGFGEQVHVRADSPLSFFHHPDAAGPRARMRRAGSGFSVEGGPVITTAELLSILEREPLRFSTSALLRPIVEDTLFPTAAYVAGPGEINYFAQMPPLYSIFDLPVPLIAPRARFRIVDAHTQSLLDALRLAPSEAEAPRDQLLARCLTRSTNARGTPEHWQHELLEGFNRTLDAFESQATPVDANLSAATRRTRETVARGVGRLLGKYGRALLLADRVTAERVDRLQRALFPDGEPQERVHSLPCHAARHGIAAFKRAVFESLVPFDGTVRDLHP